MLAMPTATPIPAVYSTASTPVNSSDSTCTDSVSPITGHGGPSQKDTTWTKLFVGGLPYHTTDKSLRDHFKVYGEIDEAVVITDRQTGKSRGYGFVIMADRVSAERACKEPNPIIDGRKANVNLAILGAKPRGNVAALAATGAFSPFAATTIRAISYPSAATSAALLAASQYGIPASYIYPQATGGAYGGTPLLSHISSLQQSGATTSPAIAAALAAQQQAAAAQQQLYEGYAHHHQQSQGQAAAAAVNSAHLSSPSAQFAAAQSQLFAALAADPYNTYLAAAANGPYAAYIQAAPGNGAGGQGSLQLNPYAAAVAQESSRI